MERRVKAMRSRVAVSIAALCFLLAAGPTRAATCLIDERGQMSRQQSQYLSYKVYDAAVYRPGHSEFGIVWGGSTGDRSAKHCYGGVQKRQLWKVTTEDGKSHCSAELKPGQTLTVYSRGYDLVCDDVGACANAASRQNEVGGFTSDGVYSPAYGRPIQSNWHGVPFPVDAATKVGRHVYFFKDDEYWRYDAVNDRLDSGYPLKISSEWPGIPNKLDAAMYWSEYGRKIYFFKGDRYWRYDYDSDTVDGGYPKSISAEWPGLRGNIASATYADDAIPYGGQRSAVGYFFYGGTPKQQFDRSGKPDRLGVADVPVGRYERFDLAPNRVGSRGNSQDWFGMWRAAPQAAFYSEDVIPMRGAKTPVVYFFLGDKYNRYDARVDCAKY